MAKFYDDEEYYGGSFEKFTRRKPKNHKKGHQSRSSNSEKKTWELIIEKTNEEAEPVPEVRLNFNPAPVPTFTPQKIEHQFGENTHEIKGVKIDFDGVADIQKIDNVKDGRKTYGIKFFFKGKKGLFRIIWFNSNIVIRDATFDSEYAFWKKL